MEKSFELIVLFCAALATGGLIVNWIGLGRAMSRLSVSAYIEFHQHTNHTRYNGSGRGCPRPSCGFAQRLRDGRSL